MMQVCLGQPDLCLTKQQLNRRLVVNTLKLRDGYKLNYKFDRATEPRATVIISHGFAEHMGRYEYFSRALTDRGLNVVRYDLRGHGVNED